MQIDEIQINNFGKLKDKKIKLKNGINIIYGENESGKSTLLKFINSIFFGASRNKNGKKISDYDKFMPWNNEEYSGKIKYTLDDSKEYEVYRNFTKKNPQIFDNNGNDISKNYEIDKTYGNKFFQEQTGIDEELFNTSVIVEQQNIKLDEKRQNTLIQKASNIMLTGEDDISYNKIITKLNKKQTDEIGTSKSPTKPLYIIKQKIELLENEKERLESMLELRFEIDEERKKIYQKIQKAEKELEIMQSMQKIQKEENIESEKIEININSKKELEKNIESTIDELNNIKTSRKEKKSSNMLYIIPILLTIISIILVFIAKIQFFIVGMIIAIISFAVIFGIKSKENKKIKEQKAEEKKNKADIEIKLEMLENELKNKEKDIKEKR